MKDKNGIVNSLFPPPPHIHPSRQVYTTKSKSWRSSETKIPISCHSTRSTRRSTQSTWWSSTFPVRKSWEGSSKRSKSPRRPSRPRWRVCWRRCFTCMRGASCIGISNQRISYWRKKESWIHWLWSILVSRLLWSRISTFFIDVVPQGSSLLRSSEWKKRNYHNTPKNAIFSQLEWFFTFYWPGSHHFHPQITRKS